MTGCEFVGCPYWTGATCADPNEYVNEYGEPVCGHRNDAIFRPRDQHKLESAWCDLTELRTFRRRRRHPLTLAGWIGLAMIAGAIVVLAYAVWLSI